MVTRTPGNMIRAIGPSGQLGKSWTRFCFSTESFGIRLFPLNAIFCRTLVRLQACEVRIVGTRSTRLTVVSTGREGKPGILIMRGTRGDLLGQLPSSLFGSGYPLFPATITTILSQSFLLRRYRRTSPTMCLRTSLHGHIGRSLTLRKREYPGGSDALAEVDDVKPEEIRLGRIRLENR